jgi:ATP-dependent Clp protease protease subunit
MINSMNEQLRRIVLSGYVREETAAQFLEQITALEIIDVGKPITVYIDTYGGSVDAALLMYDAMRACSCPIVTIGIGKVMSAGVLLLASGDKRFITENTRVMLHEVSGGVFGAVTEMENSVKEMHRLQDVYVNLLSGDTGQSKQKILEDIEKNTLYMTAKDAVAYGIVDTIVPTRKKTRRVTDKPKKQAATKKATTRKKKVTKKKD